MTVRILLAATSLLLPLAASAADLTPRAYARRFLGCMKKKDKACLESLLPHGVKFSPPERLDCPVADKKDGKATPAELIDCAVDRPAATGAVRLRDALIGCFARDSKWDGEKKTFRAKNDVVCRLAGAGKKVSSLESIVLPAP